MSLSRLRRDTWARAASSGQATNAHSPLPPPPTHITPLQVEEDKWARGGKQWPASEAAAFKAGIAARYDEEGSPYYASARLWDDGVIDPADTRRVVSVGLIDCHCSEKGAVGAFWCERGAANGWL